MTNHLISERFQWFDGKVKLEKYPNAGSLAKQFEGSSRTAQRDIEFLRDRLSAPLEYDHVHRGYSYSDHSFELPRLQGGALKIFNWYSVLMGEKNRPWQWIMFSVHDRNFPYRISQAFRDERCRGWILSGEGPEHRSRKQLSAIRMSF
ncbi:MAG: hypothetical protein PHQ97_01900 [Desulfobacterales bacterium]|nr:hypothetical protein [Desulfobacterales bacterium]